MLQSSSLNNMDILDKSLRLWNFISIFNHTLQVHRNRYLHSFDNFFHRHSSNGNSRKVWNIRAIVPLSLLNYNRVFHGFSPLFRRCYLRLRKDALKRFWMDIFTIMPSNRHSSLFFSTDKITLYTQTNRVNTPI